MLAVARALAANSPALDDVFCVSATSFDRHSEGDRGNRDSGWLGGTKGTVAPKLAEDELHQGVITRSHSAGGASSSRGISCVRRFPNVVRTAAPVLALSRFSR
jgi:hypothetical protein